jgi:hypothetical protein
MTDDKGRISFITETNKSKAGAATGATGRSISASRK